MNLQCSSCLEPTVAGVRHDCSEVIGGLRARINDLIVDCAAWESCSNAGDEVIGGLRAELKRLREAVDWMEDYLMGTIPKYGEAARCVDALEELRKMKEGG